MRKLRRKIPKAQDVLNAEGWGIYGLIVGTSRREKERLTMRLSVMCPKKKKLLSKKNF
jgi:hypothetical protein